MRSRTRSRRRRGAILPLVALCMVPLVGFVALAVDLGMVALAKTECQNAADAAAMSGMRTINGDSAGSDPYRYNLAIENAKSAAAAQPVLGVFIDPESTQFKYQFGAYVYNTNTSLFEVVVPKPSSENYTLMRTRVAATSYNAFGSVWGVNQFNVAAVSTAVHRPRDIALVLDFSGSMNNESDLWNNEGYLGSYNNSPNNRDTRIPQWGPYSISTNPATAGTNPTLLIAGSANLVGRCNITQAALGVQAMVGDYFTTGGAAAFAAQPNLYMTNPLGDNWLRENLNNGSAPYTKTVNRLTNSSASEITNFVTQGYDRYYPAVNRPFKGYTMGPAYWGKMFMVWPPDPRAPVQNPGAGGHLPGDWRRRFFINGNGSLPTSSTDFSNGVTNNNRLFNTNGTWKNPCDPNNATSAQNGYRINYGAILRWIKQTPNPFPTMLTAGRILYYDAIPDDVPAAAYNHQTLNRNVAWTSQNERFWKEYIDYVLGCWRSPMNSVVNPGSPACSYGPDFTWNEGTPSTSAITNPAPGGQYMGYDDRPQFPRHRMWFGPQSMIQFISDTGMLPGTARDISMFVLKLGVQAAFQDIKVNYPNTKVSLAMFNRPRFNGEGEEVGRFFVPHMELTSDYTALINSLWYPPGSTSSSQIRPWDTLGAKVPRAYGDFTSNTSSYYGMIMAHNQLSSSAAARTAGLGGFGRRGAERLLIFESDGMANQGGSLSSQFGSLFVSGTEGDSYYDVSSTIVNGNTSAPNLVAGGSASGDTYTVADKLVSQESSGGMARSNLPVTIHTLAFGAVMDSGASGSEQSNVVTFLQTISSKGGTVFPSSATDPTNGYKWIIGNQTERKEKLRTAILKTMKSGVRIAMIYDSGAENQDWP